MFFFHFLLTFFSPYLCFSLFRVFHDKDIRSFPLARRESYTLHHLLLLLHFMSLHIAYVFVVAFVVVFSSQFKRIIFQTRCLETVDKETQHLSSKSIQIPFSFSALHCVSDFFRIITIICAENKLLHFNFTREKTTQD